MCLTDGAPYPTVLVMDNLPRIRLIVAIIVSVATSLAFFLALAVAYLKNDETNIGLMIGAVIANSTTVVGFWLGSSISSQQKTDLLARQQVPPP